MRPWEKGVFGGLLTLVFVLLIYVDEDMREMRAALDEESARIAYSQGLLSGVIGKINEDEAQSVEKSLAEVPKYYEEVGKSEPTLKLCATLIRRVDEAHKAAVPIVDIECHDPHFKDFIGVAIDAGARVLMAPEPVPDPPPPSDPTLTRRF